MGTGGRKSVSEQWLDDSTNNFDPVEKALEEVQVRLAASVALEFSSSSNRLTLVSRMGLKGTLYPAREGTDFVMDAFGPNLFSICVRSFFRKPD